ncbi:hypothetical protein H8356DRAFT_1330479 [Neocallimastix lanati (nom. inval.)]|nr:hypothetical protein H8356DRAFT_1330479 [Neocallimastix sp. JGI-2020a]
MGFERPEYNAIKFQITRNIKRQLPPEVTKFDEILNESKYYKTVRNENFMIFKNPNLIIFQSIFQIKLDKNLYLIMIANEKSRNDIIAIIV